jgi:hypothetical protein
MAMVLVAGLATADIGFQFTSAGVFGPGGNFTAGPWPSGDQVIQILWSAVNPETAGFQAWANTTDYLDPSGSEVKIVGEVGGGTTSDGAYGYIQPAAFGLVEVFDANVGLPDGGSNAGFLYGRMFADGSPATDEWYYQGPAITDMVPYDPTNPSTIFTYDFTPGQTIGASDGGEANGIVQIPEPSTLLLCGFGLLALAVRRFRR